MTPSERQLLIEIAKVLLGDVSNLRGALYVIEREDVKLDSEK